LCERVNREEIKKLISLGITDMNQIKAITRAGMGSCGGKTCASLMERLFKEENISEVEIEKYTIRPTYIEMTLGDFAGVKFSGEKND